MQVQNVGFSSELPQIALTPKSLANTFVRTYDLIQIKIFLHLEEVKHLPACLRGQQKHFVDIIPRNLKCKINLSEY
jgi:hypothetical protein